MASGSYRAAMAQSAKSDMHACRDYALHVASKEQDAVTEVSAEIPSVVCLVRIH